MTTEDELSYLPLQVIRVGDNGKRTFDAEDKRRLIEACRRPGVSLSGMALKAGVNANQLHKWVHGRGRKHGRGSEAAVLDSDAGGQPAFVPVVAVGNVVGPMGAGPTVLLLTAHRPGYRARSSVTHRVGRCSSASLYRYWGF